MPDRKAEEFKRLAGKPWTSRVAEKFKDARGIEVLTTIALLVLMLAASGWAEEPSSATPDLELLEFLGTFETQNGEWIDPLELLELPELDPEEVRNESNSDETKRPDRQLR